MTTNFTGNKEKKCYQHKNKKKIAVMIKTYFMIKNKHFKLFLTRMVLS